MSPDILKKFGLTDQEARAYIALLQLGTSTIKPIADRSGLKRTSIYNFIEKLIEMELVSRTIVRGRNHYTAVNPERLLEIEQSRLKDLENMMPFLHSMYHSSGSRPKVSYLEGASQITQILKEETRCKKEALYIWPGKNALDVIGGANVMSEIDRVRIRKKIWVKTIRFRQKDATYNLSQNTPKYFRDMRWAPPEVRISMGMGIYDTGKVGLFSSPKENFGILIDSLEVQQLMTVLFMMFWGASLPAREGEG
jgi:sugar-specific transcriptional regulator TrmB